VTNGSLKREPVLMHPTRW